ncbi:hypothetical protein Q5752_006941 [Cryptotrichosporon argae]
MLPEVVYDYVEDVDPNLMCAICQSALVDPVTTTSCKHTFCRDCITRSLSHSPRCPIDRSALTAANLRATEQIVVMMLDELKVRCAAAGCGKVMQRGLLLPHLRTCTRSVIVCGEGCGLSMSRDRMPHHRAYECFQRRMECGKCGTTVAFREAKSSAAASEDEAGAGAGVTCAQCAQTITTSPHAHQWTCPAVLVPCVHAARGCSGIVARSDLAAHLESCPFEGLSAYFATVDERFRTMEERVTAVERDNAALRAEVERLERHARRPAGSLSERLAEAMSVQRAEPTPATLEDTAPPADGGITTRAAADMRALDAGGPARELLAPPRRNYADWTLGRLARRAGDGGDVDAVRAAVVQLAAGLDAVERRTEVRTMTETLRVLDEVGSLRAIVSSLRMQVMTPRPHSDWSDPSARASYPRQPTPTPTDTIPILGPDGDVPFARPGLSLTEVPVSTRSTYASGSHGTDALGGRLGPRADVSVSAAASTVPRAEARVSSRVSVAHGAPPWRASTASPSPSPSRASGSAPPSPSPADPADPPAPEEDASETASIRESVVFSDQGSGRVPGAFAHTHTHTHTHTLARAAPLPHRWTGQPCAIPAAPDEPARGVRRLGSLLRPRSSRANPTA